LVFVKEKEGNFVCLRIKNEEKRLREEEKQREEEEKRRKADMVKNQFAKFFIKIDTPKPSEVDKVT
jgi:hypothetical protein